MTTVALIPARGGSVRVPRKNLEVVGAHSLVARAIICAKAVGRIRDVYVSTDDAEIAIEAAAYGAEIITRPAELALDESPMEDVVRHFIRAAKVPDFGVVVLLEPSAPFRTPVDIQTAISYLDARPDAFGVRTMTRIEEPNYFLHTIGARGFMDPLTPEAYKSIHRPPIYRDNGLVNVFRVGQFLDVGSLMTTAVLGLEIGQPIRGIDVDTPEDLALARMYVHDLD